MNLSTMHTRTAQIMTQTTPSKATRLAGRLYPSVHRTHTHTRTRTRTDTHPSQTPLWSGWYMAWASTWRGIAEPPPPPFITNLPPWTVHSELLGAASPTSAVRFEPRCGQSSASGMRAVPIEKSASGCQDSAHILASMIERLFCLCCIQTTKGAQGEMQSAEPMY